tara:strand:+ start:811 stop:1239 length:429 start_codon:yes stop_codon:yes gene_type:complete
MEGQLNVDISFSEMIKNMFDGMAMSESELITICAAAEMYADGRAKDFTNWVTQKKSPYAVMYDDGEIRFATNGEDLSINQVFEKYKEWRKSSKGQKLHQSLLDEAVSDVITISTLNTYSDAVELIKKQFVVMSKEDLLAAVR